MEIIHKHNCRDFSDWLIYWLDGDASSELERSVQVRSSLPMTDEEGYEETVCKYCQITFLQGNKCFLRNCLFYPFGELRLSLYSCSQNISQYSNRNVLCFLRK